MGIANTVVSGKILSGTYKELEDVTGGCDDRGEWETKSYLCEWGKRSEFIRDFKGLSSISGGSSGTWKTQVPYALPDNPRLYVRDITFTPEGALVPGVTPIRFTHARMNVTFRQPDFNYTGLDDPGFQNSLSQDPDENAAMLFCTQELDFGKEWITLPNSSVKFASDGKLINSPKGRSVSVYTMNLTWHKYPVMPMTLVRGYADSVNNAKFLGCAKGTVIFDAPRTIREASTDGTVTQKVQFAFRWRQYDWNKQLRDDGLTWDYVVDKGYTTGSTDAYCNYAYKDFSKLLLTR